MFGAIFFISLFDKCHKWLTNMGANIKLVSLDKFTGNIKIMYRGMYFILIDKVDIISI